MELNNIKLTNFKNYSTLVVDFDDKLNVITGLNGVGKTNLLDAIYYICSCKSYFQASDKSIITFEQGFFNITANFKKKAEDYNLFCKYSPRRKKEFECNRNIYDTLAEHIGKFPVSIITPDDIQIVKAGSEFRRKLVNHTLSQISAEYLSNLMKYNKILQQRNAYLKQISGIENMTNFSLLDTYDAQLVNFSKPIYKLRKNMMPECTQFLQNCYEQISNGREKVNIQYISNLNNNNFEELLKTNRQKDRILKRTTVGIHKDDWEFGINNHSIKKIGSQGQQKSFLIALKLAFFQFVKEKLNIEPILLLDDIFDKLDATRIAELLKIVTANSYGQVFITDADSKRLPAILDSLNLQYKHFIIENEKILLTET